MLDPKHGFTRCWNLKKLLGSHENAHVAFTVSAQMSAGAFMLLAVGGAIFPALKAFQSSVGWAPTLVILALLLIFGLFRLNMHLGRPHRFYRGYYNLRYSPVAREIAGVTVFSMGLMGYVALNVLRVWGPGITRLVGLNRLIPDSWFSHPLFAMAQYACVGTGLLGIAFGGFYMIKLYRIKARPFWNHWHTDASFVGTTLSLGAAILMVLSLVFSAASGDLARVLAATMAIGLAIEAAGIIGHARDLNDASSEGAASYYEQTTTYGYPYLLRNGLLIAAFALASLIVAFPGSSGVLLGLLAALSFAQSILGRTMFYVIVIPTTMPGAFFWRNPGFVEHARKTGLAKMPQVGVAYEHHHPFRIDELVATIMKTPLKEKYAQLKRIFTG